MSREQLEEAITAMTAAMGDSAGEVVYQAIFEEHPIILEVLGYSRSQPHPILPLKDGRRYVPDFIVERRDSRLAEILDLKVPDTRILLGRERREAFTASMNSYLGQMNDYQDYFDEAAHRDAISSTYALSVPRAPRAVLIAGRNAEIDRPELHRQLTRRQGVSLITFDDVVEMLQFEYGRHYGSWEGVGGLTYCSVVRIHRCPEDRLQYLFEAEGVDGFGFSVLIDRRGRIVLRSHSPADHDVEVTAVAMEHDRWLALTCALGAQGPSTLLQLRIDDRVVAEQRLEDFDPGSRPLQHMTIGANREGRYGAVFDLAFIVLYDRLLSFQDRRELAEHCRAVIERSGPYVELSAESWYATDGDPGLPSGLGQPEQ